MCGLNASKLILHHQGVASNKHLIWPASSFSSGSWSLSGLSTVNLLEIINTLVSGSSQAQVLCLILGFLPELLRGRLLECISHLVTGFGVCCLILDLLEGLLDAKLDFISAPVSDSSQA